MERTKVKDARLRWKKVGGGSLRILDRIIKPGQTFVAYLEEIPEAFRDTLVCLDEGKLPELEEELAVPTAPKPIYEVKKEEDGKGWNVVNKTSDKKINDAPLRTRKEAEELKAALEG